MEGVRKLRVVRRLDEVGRLGEPPGWVDRKLGVLQVRTSGLG